MICFVLNFSVNVSFELCKDIYNIITFIPVILQSTGNIRRSISRNLSVQRVCKSINPFEGVELNRAEASQNNIIQINQEDSKNIVFK